MRRSGPINEVYLFDVAFETTFDQIEQLRARMLEFVEVERRDFLPKVSTHPFSAKGSRLIRNRSI